MVAGQMDSKPVGFRLRSTGCVLALMAALSLVAVQGCGSDSEPTPGGSGGTAGSVGTGGQSAGGTAGSAGVSASGGSAGVAGQGGSAGAAGSTAGSAGSAGKGGAAGSGGSAACSTNADCLAQLPTTQPADCADAECKSGTCRFFAKDKDGDGAAAKFCKDPTQTVTIEAGKDCDDGNNTMYPGAWDGPADGTHAAACDGVDQDCSGAPDDVVLADKTSCICHLGDQADCSETDNGSPITWPMGSPVGECKYGTRVCVFDATTGGGKWDKCTGAVAPKLTESCDDADNDCDGETDEDSASDAVTWYCDADGDGHLSATPTSEKACLKPTKPCGVKGDWIPSGSKDDCDDANEAKFPGLPETCDGLDNNCNGSVDEGAADMPTWYLDGDSDGYGSDSVPAVTQCAAPTATWKKAQDLLGLNNDCKDNDGAAHPGAWDGPRAEAAGLQDTGFAVQVFLMSTGACSSTPSALPNVKAQPVRYILNDWGLSGPLGPSCTCDCYQVRWTGQLSVATSGTYTFYADADDGVRVKLGGQTVIDHWQAGATSQSGSVHIDKEVLLEIVVEHYDESGASKMILEWEGPGFSRRPLSRREARTADDSCNGVDNDCDGQTDNQPLARCGTCASRCTVGTPDCNKLGFSAAVCPSNFDVESGGTGGTNPPTRGIDTCSISVTLE